MGQLLKPLNNLAIITTNRLTPTRTTKNPIKNFLTRLPEGDPKLSPARCFTDGAKDLEFIDFTSVFMGSVYNGFIRYAENCK
ncbi:MAG TPA: hypothetical protein DDW65_05825 [Firmicutes bacterium]|nr:hypothetical protein [Bacillota bacterium]